MLRNLFSDVAIWWPRRLKTYWLHHSWSPAGPSGSVFMFLCSFSFGFSFFFFLFVTRWKTELRFRQEDDVTDRPPHIHHYYYYYNHQPDRPCWRWLIFTRHPPLRLSLTSYVIRADSRVSKGQRSNLCVFHPGCLTLSDITTNPDY